MAPPTWRSNSAALGAQAVLLGLTGQDEAADALASQMAGVRWLVISCA